MLRMTSAAGIYAPLMKAKVLRSIVNGQQHSKHVMWFPVSVFPNGILRMGAYLVVSQGPPTVNNIPTVCTKALYMSETQFFGNPFLMSSQVWLHSKANLVCTPISCLLWKLEHVIWKSENSNVPSSECTKALIWATRCLLNLEKI